MVTNVDMWVNTRSVLCIVHCHLFTIIETNGNKHFPTNFNFHPSFDKVNKLQMQPSESGSEGPFWPSCN